ncbi:DUF3566 domain-containing protein [Streptomyces olivaceoviridis]|uniref:DUF3566 domain-containing protein n=1 Tax=Streptomyces olivaceoviridis TaxID=1921 RepID=UPI001E5FF93D|nr:DUF3566 domain-containing protein [Streptomyces olivaceoviridis]
MSRAKRRPPVIAGEQAAVTQGGGARSSPENGSTAPPHPAERSVPVKEPEASEESGESEESGVAEGAGPAPASGAAAAPGPRTIRMRISEGDPWSVMVTSFLLLAGVGILAFATTVVLWILMEAMAPDVLPDLGTVVAIAIGVVTVEVVLGTGLATLGTFLYNLSSLYSGGVEVSVTDDLDLSPDAARVLPALARARARVRRSLRGRTPRPRSWSR